MPNFGYQQQPVSPPGSQQPPQPPAPAQPPAPPAPITGGESGNQGVQSPAPASNFTPSNPPPPPVIQQQFDYGEFSGAGSEDFTYKDVDYPYVLIIQSQSKELNPQEPDRYVEGAKIGNLYHTIDRQLIDFNTSIVTFLVIKQARFITAYNSKNEFVTTYEHDSGVDRQATMKQVGEKKLRMLPDGTHLVDKANYLGLLQCFDPSNLQVPWYSSISVISFKNQGVRNSFTAWNKEMLKIIQKTKAPTFAIRARVSLVNEQNSSGQKWLALRFAFHSFVDPASDLFQALKSKYEEFKDFNKQFSAGSGSTAAAADDSHDAPAMPF